MSIISTGTTLTTGLVLTSDINGNLIIKTGTSGTTAVTVSASQVVSLANALPASSGGTGLTSAGTTGNILVSNGTGWVSQAPAAGGAQDFIVQSYGIV